MNTDPNLHGALPGRYLTRRNALKKGMLAMAGAPLLPGLLESALGSSIHPDPLSARILEAAVVTIDPEADTAAFQALKQGGNAIDAAVAATMALCIVRPSSVGFGGYGGSMAIYLAKQRHVTSIDFDSCAPLEFRPELFSDPERANHGYLAIGVPGVVAGFDLALRKYGNLSWRAASEHALSLAENGYQVSPDLASNLSAFARQADPASVKAYFPDGKVPAPGDRWVQKDLAGLIRAVGDGGADTFYRGKIAESIVRQVRDKGGILSMKDFNAFNAREVVPLHIDYRGYDLYTPPPPAGGITSLSILKTLEQFDLKTTGRWGGEYFHLFAEASKLCWAERFKQLGDPEVARFSAEEMLSAATAAERARKIKAGSVSQVAPPGPAPQHTVNVVVIDREGNAASLTATHGGGFGSRVAIAGLGLVLGHGMSRFTLQPDSPNFPAPGKRMQHNMSPLLALRDGRLTHAIGMPGGRMIVTVSAQLAVSLIDFKASAREAVNAPRLHTEGEEPLTISPAASSSAIRYLESRGHRLKHAGVAGAVNVAIVDHKTGKIDSASGRKTIAS